MKNKYIKMIAALTTLMMLFAFVQVSPAKAAGSTLNDGQYTINYDVYYAGVKSNRFDSYLNKTAAVTVSNSTYSVKVNVLDSKTISDFQVEKDGSYVSAPVVETGENTKAVKFDAADLTARKDVRINVVVSSASYDKWYDIQLVFDASSMTKVEPVLADGTYTMNLSVLHATKEEESSMKSYLESTALLEVKDGKKVVYLTLKDRNTVTEFQTARDGITYVKAATAKDSTTDQSTIVKFEVDKLIDKLNSKVHVVTSYVDKNGVTQIYDMWHNIRLLFNTASIQSTTVTVPETPGTETPGTGNPGTETPGTGTPTPGVIADGKYSVNFSILKAGTSEASVMNGFVYHPATLDVINGVKKVTLRLTQSKEITEFKVEGATPSTVASDSSGNTRDVQFTVSDLSTKLNAWVHINWPEVGYNHDYDVQISFGSHTDYVDPSKPTGSIPTVPDVEDEEEAPGTAVVLNDIGGHWAKDSIERAIKLGIVTGYGDSTFRPEATVSRAEFTALIARALKLKGTAGSIDFSDEAKIPAWAKTYIEQAIEAGIISGYENGTFRPAQNVSRAEIAVMMVRALKLTLDENAELTFADGDKVPSYAKASIAAAVKAGLINGKDNNHFDPNTNATRAEAVTFILRTLDYLEAKQPAKETAAK